MFVYLWIHVLCISVFALPLWPPLSCRVLPTCWLSRANEQSLLRIGFKSILAQNICVASFLYLCIHELCICVFADWDKLTRSPKQPRLGMSFKSILTQPKLFVFLKENSVNCAPCLFVFTDNVYSNNIGTRGDILLAAHGSSNCAFTFFQQTCQEFFWSTS